MAKPPQPLKLQIEDYPDFDKETAEKLFPKLNQFFDEVSSGLDRGLTAQDNLRALVKTIDISVVAANSGVTGSGTPGQLAKWLTSTSLGDGGSAGGGSSSPRPDANHLFFLDFDEAAGATAVLDKTGNGNNFTVSSIGAGVFGAVVPIPGYDRTGLLLKGETALYNIHLASGPEPAYPVTLEFAYVPIGPSPGTWSMLINKNYRPTTWVSPWVALNLQKENSTDGSYSTGITTGSASNLKVTTPTWTKIAHTAQQIVYMALTYDGATFNSYINGQLFNSTARTGAIDYGTHGDWSVGSEGVNSTEAFPVQGVMVRAALSNIARSASYFQSVYKSLMGQP